MHRSTWIFSFILFSVFTLTKSWKIGKVKNIFAQEGVAEFAPCAVEEKNDNDTFSVVFLNDTSGEEVVTIPTFVTTEMFASFAILHFRQPNLTDSGSYTCNVTVNETWKSKSFNLSVVEKFRWNDCSVNQYLLEESSDKQLIKCLVPKSYQNSIFWTKNGEDLPKNFKSVENGIEVINFTIYDIGYYKINVSNEYIHEGSEERDIFVDFAEAPIITNPNISEVTVNRKNFELKCEASGKPQPIIRWFDSNNKNLKEDERGGIEVKDGVLRINNEEYFSELGETTNFSCVAENSVNSTSHEVIVYLYEEPEIVQFEGLKRQEGSTVEVICRAKGFPLPNVTISKEFGETLEQSEVISESELPMFISKVIHFENIKKEDAGVYRCLIQNKYATDSKTVSVTVNYAPQIHASNVDVKMCETNATVHCVVDSNPIAKVVWKKNDKELKGNLISTANSVVNSTLNIKIDGEGKFEGVYVCEANNEIGKRSQNISVTQTKIVNPPENIVLSNTKSTSVTIDVKQTSNCFTVEKFLFEITEKPFSTKVVKTFEGNVKFPVQIDDLSANTEYSIKVAILTTDGLTSTYSREFHTKTSKDPLPSLIIVIVVISVIILVLLDIYFFYTFRCGLLFCLLSACGCIRVQSSFKIEETGIRLTSLKNGHQFRRRRGNETGLNKDENLIEEQKRLSLNVDSKLGVVNIFNL
ncbi:Fasciclin-2-like protein [Leptotrombidium deliense]|uniref:Fasciclin-2-like protein n=1 Tax=Leptotrombidium deliense TaxID=299467 RepID=A0A443S9E1_9ACAR|nr:Fasciclin-2-like protein [Leptotrombidium deliense]